MYALQTDSQLYKSGSTVSNRKNCTYSDESELLRVVTPMNERFYENNINVSILRKSKIFIKSRFSRNRQWCRPIVIWSVWINVLFLGFSIVIFYGFKFKIGYIPGTISIIMLIISLSNLASIGSIKNRYKILVRKLGKLKKLFN